MKKVVSPKIKDLFRYQSSLKDFWDTEREFSIHNPFTYTALIITICLLAGLKSKVFLLMGISFLIPIIIFYGITRIQAHSLTLKRIVPKRGTEYQSLNVLIRVSNNSSLPLLDYKIFDSFSGNQKGRISITPYKKISARSRRTIKIPWVADGGMGEKTFSDLVMEVRDPMDFFTFYIKEDKEDTIPIYPHQEKIPSIEVSFNENSFHYGELDIQKRGESINFMGIRDYRRGDPVKRINWRQTARQSKPIVNIFERNINKSITLIYNNALELHSGYAAESTEEYCKDLILSIAAENISNGNQLRLVTQDKITPWGAEKNFINRLELFLLDLNLTSVNQPENFIKDVLNRSGRTGIKQSSLFYFTPLLATPQNEKTFEDIVGLRNQGIPIKIFGINPYNFVDSYFHYGAFSGVKGHIVAVERMVEKWRPIFRRYDIPFYPLTVNKQGSLYAKVLSARRAYAGEN